MPVVTISRQFGAGGLTLAKAAAKRLNYKFVSASIIDKMAKEANVSIEWIKSVEKYAGDGITRFLNKLVSSDFIDRHIGEDRADFDESRYVVFLENLIKRIAEEDNVLFLGRGSQFILQDNPNAIKILLVADFEDRVKFIEKAMEVNKGKAEKIITTRQKRRDAFSKYFDDRHPNSLSLYHLIINTSKVSLSQAEDLIVWTAENTKAR